MIKLKNIISYFLLSEGLKDEYNLTDDDLKIVKSIGHEKYIRWIIKQYKKDSDFEKNIDKYKKTLDTFELKRKQKKLKSDSTNIEKYKDLTDLESSIESHENDTKEEIKKNGGELIYEDSNWIILIPRTYEASCIYGKDTSWCTARDDTRSHYDEYMEEGDLYIIINKHKKDERYQFHLIKNQYKISGNKDVDIEDTYIKKLYEICIKDFIKKLENKSDDEIDGSFSHFLDDIFFNLMSEKLKFKYIKKAFQLSWGISNIQFDWCSDELKLKYFDMMLQYHHQVSDDLLVLCSDKILMLYVKKIIDIQGTSEIGLTDLVYNHIPDVLKMKYIEKRIEYGKWISKEKFDECPLKLQKRFVISHIKKNLKSESELSYEISSLLRIVKGNTEMIRFVEKISNALKKRNT